MDYGKSTEAIMIQPKREEIIHRLQAVVADQITREAVGTWALEFIINDEYVEIDDWKAWQDLVSISSIDLMVAPNEYLYSIEDIQAWIEEISKQSHSNITLPDQSI